MKVAVVGAGIAGLVAARELSRGQEVHVFEAADWIGGHTHTVDVDDPQLGRIPVDTGFIVFNEATYPGLCALLRELGVAWKPSDMSFSVRVDAADFEYNGTNLDGLLAQRSNALRPRFWRMVRDILRFYREAPAVLERPDDGTTLGAFLERGRYSREFVEHHLVPMGAAVWSSSRAAMWSFPLRFLVQFFHNHGFLKVDDRPQWLVVAGGSRAYVEPLVAPFRERVHARTPVARVERGAEGVRLVTAAGEAAWFDRVVLATHADTSLRLLADATPLEREVLGAFRFQRNEVLLHTDARLMPRRRRAWASWNYHVTDPPSELPTVTYWMNRLQSIPSSTDYLVTLNRAADVDPARVLGRWVYHHPIFDQAAVAAQRRHAEVDGRDRVHFCGAYWRWGFHEDGLWSAQVAARRVRPEAVLA
ncbi:MAG: FAD-dependent oxidoreductase [Planctomycetes bacterium]|nr:FAD-dependent oxidoreductase [Planctomycetota bacterium]